MTREEKEDILYNYCESTACGDCLLRDEGWEHSKGVLNCLLFEQVDDAELDRAIAYITDRTIELGDVVNKASHYNQGGIECIKAIEASMSPEEYSGFLKGQVIKYVWRYRHKGKPSEDLKKARYYLDELIRVTERGESDD